MDADSGKYGRRRRKQLAADLESHIQGADPKDAQAQLEKLKAGLSLVLEQAKVDMAATSEADRTRVGLFRAVTPLLVTAALSGLGSFVTLTYQSRQHSRDAQAQQEQAKTASDRQGQELQATEQTNARKERTDLLERLAQSIAAGPAPAASCWYVEGIWNDYAPGDPLPEVLAVRCRAADAGAGGPPAPVPWGQWVVVADTDRTREAGCLSAIARVWTTWISSSCSSTRIRTSTSRRRASLRSGPTPSGICNESVRFAGARTSRGSRARTGFGSTARPARLPTPAASEATRSRDAKNAGGGMRPRGCARRGELTF